VAARLLNRAKSSGDDYQSLLTNFCFERFLYRLGVSALKDKFILKGAMLLRVWSHQPYRATRDLDFLRRGDASFDAIRADIQTVCATAVAPDAVARRRPAGVAGCTRAGNSRHAAFVSESDSRGSAA
jgi:hypothetical protein